MKQSDDPIGKWRSDNAVHQIATDTAAQVAAKISAATPTKSREQEITERADQVVWNCCNRFLVMRNIKVIPTTRQEAVMLLHGLLLEEFKTFTHEELVILCSFQNSIIATEQLHEALI